jgi:hypothetical protein
VPAEGAPTTVPFLQISSIDIVGHTSQSGGGFFGGGFGARGAATGMLVASALNGLTKSIDKWVVVSISGPGGSIEMHIPNAEEEQVRRAFRSVKDAVVASSVTGSLSVIAAEADLVSKIERLAALREAGHLSDEEFGAAKSRLLG